MRLAETLPLAQLDAIVVTHSHPDHCLDLVMMRQALVHAPEPSPDRAIPVYVGQGTVERYLTMGRALLGDGEEVTDPWAGALEFRPFDPATRLTVGQIGLTFAPTEHYVPCWAIRFEHDDRRIVFTADTGPSEAVTDLAAGADLLLAEATLPSRDGHALARGHLAPEEAGVMAARAGAGRLVLTHYFVEYGVEKLRSRAEKSFGQRVEIAMEGERYAA
jgi:ribonuclease BN (tRNA processing enzyme)